MTTIELDDLPLAAVLVDERGVVRRANKDFLAITGGDPRVGQPYASTVVAPAHGYAREQLAALLSGKVDRVEMDYPCTADDAPGWLRLLGSRTAAGVLLVHQDVTPDTWLASSVDADPDPFLRFDPSGRLVGSSRGWLRLVGGREAGTPGGWVEHVHPEDQFKLRLALDEAARGGGVAEAEVRVDGVAGWSTQRFRVVRHELDGGRVELLAFGHDVTDDVALREQLEARATTDDLTGLVNRGVLREHLHRALLDGQRDASASAVVFVDVNDFKTINDLHGHVVGDAVLVEVARRLSAAVRPGDVVARYGGDEFVLLLHPAPTGMDAVVQRVRDAMVEPVTFRGLELQVGIAVGAALSTPDDATADLLARADRAMYADKSSHPVDLGSDRSAPTS